MAKVRTRKRGKTWSYVFEAGRKADGKRLVIEKGGYRTQEAAYDAGTAAYTDWKHGNIGITSERITVPEFMRNWIDNVATLNVRATTLAHYKDIDHNWIAPYFSGTVLQDLTPAMCDQWMRELARKGLARLTLRSIYALFHHALDYAVYPAELIASNPVVYIKVPRSAPLGVIKRTIVSPEQVDNLLEKYPAGSLLHIPLLLLYHTGMRRGEVVGLSWDNVDLDKRTISLVQQIVYLSARKGMYFAEPKTQSSRRKFGIDEILVEELRHWKRQQELNEQKYGDAYVYTYCSEDDNRLVQVSKRIAPEPGWIRIHPICTRQNGRVVTADYIGRLLRKENLNPHSFRHTHATLLIENGATPKGVAGRLGHRNAVITQNLYTHNTEKLQEDTAAIFEVVMQTRCDCRQIADGAKQ